MRPIFSHLIRDVTLCMSPCYSDRLFTGKARGCGSYRTIFRPLIGLLNTGDVTSVEPSEASHLAAYPAPAVGKMRGRVIRPTPPRPRSRWPMGSSPSRRTGPPMGS